MIAEFFNNVRPHFFKPNLYALAFNLGIVPKRIKCTVNRLAPEIALSPDDFCRPVFIFARQRSPLRSTVAAEKLRSREKILVHIKINIYSRLLAFIENTADKLKIFFVIFARLGFNGIPCYSETYKIHSVSLHVGGKAFVPLLTVNPSLSLDISALIAHVKTRQNSFTSV